MKEHGFIDYPQLNAAASLKLIPPNGMMSVTGPNYPQLNAAASLKRLRTNSVLAIVADYPQLNAAASLKLPYPHP